MQFIFFCLVYLFVFVPLFYTLFLRIFLSHLPAPLHSILLQCLAFYLLVLVVDISRHGIEDQINVVNQTLTDIGAGEKPVMMVFNKIDAFNFEKKDDDDLTPVTKRNISLPQLKKTRLNKFDTL